MAGKLINMSKIKQMLLLKNQGHSNRAIGRELGLYKETINRYFRIIESNNLDIDSLLLLEDPILESQFSPGNPAYLDKRFEDFKVELSDIEKSLGKPHVTRYLLWEEYISKYPDGYRYTQFCYHLQQHQKAKSPKAVLFDTYRPADMLFVDFAGDKMSYINRETGEEIKVQIFVATLPYSDHYYALCIPSQKVEDFIYALGMCIHSLGGVPCLLVSDNLKSAVVKSDRYLPEINRILEDFANHYGIAVNPARALKPTDKALVENAVKNVYRRVKAPLRNRIFLSLKDLNAAIAEQILKYNQTRMQQRPYSRQERFLADEKPLLKPLPEQPFEIKHYCDLTVGTNNHIYLGRDKHHYSVPYTYIGNKVKVIYTRTLVKIFCKGEQIAIHSRGMGFGYTTTKEHLCSTHQHYLNRSPDYYIAIATKKSKILASVMEVIFSSDLHPEVLYKRCDGLLSLQRKTNPEDFNQACCYALDNNACSYGFIKNVLENGMIKNVESANTENYISTPHENIRGKNYYK